MTSSAATTIRQRLDALRPQLLAVATCHGFVNKDRLYLESIRDGLEALVRDAGTIAGDASRGEAAGRRRRHVEELAATVASTESEIDDLQSQSRVVASAAALAVVYDAPELATYL